MKVCFDGDIFVYTDVQIQLVTSVLNLLFATEMNTELLGALLIIQIFFQTSQPGVGVMKGEFDRLSCVGNNCHCGFVRLSFESIKRQLSHAVKKVTICEIGYYIF